VLGSHSIMRSMAGTVEWDRRLSISLGTRTWGVQPNSEPLMFVCKLFGHDFSFPTLTTKAHA